MRVLVSWSVARSGPTGHAASLVLDWDGSEESLVEHVLADPARHSVYLDSEDDDSSSPDTSRGYILDLLGRIDEVAGS